MKLEEIDILSYHKGKIEYKPKKETVKLYKSLKTHANGEVSDGDYRCAPPE